MAKPKEGVDYEVVLGDTFKARNNKYLYHTLTYNFKPASIDKKNPGILQKTKLGHLRVQFQQLNNPNERAAFKGNYQPSREKLGECFLIFDGKQFRIEKVEGGGLVHHNHAAKMKNPISIEDQLSTMQTPSEWVNNEEPGRSSKKRDAEFSQNEPGYKKRPGKQMFNPMRVHQLEKSLEKKLASNNTKAASNDDSGSDEDLAKEISNLLELDIESIEEVKEQESSSKTSVSLIETDDFSSPAFMEKSSVSNPTTSTTNNTTAKKKESKGSETDSSSSESDSSDSGSDSDSDSGSGSDSSASSGSSSSSSSDSESDKDKKK